MHNDNLNSCFSFLSYMKNKSHVLPSVSNLSFDNKIAEVMVTLPYTYNIKLLETKQNKIKNSHSTNP